MCGVAYNRGILYYTITEKSKEIVIAYDLINRKELCRVNGSSPFVLENDNIVVDSVDRAYDIVDKDGNVIASSVYPTATSVYFKVSEDFKKIEIYDNKTKINELTVRDFISPLSNGMFVVREDGTEWRNYGVYDKNLKLITKLDDCPAFKGSVLGYSNTINVASVYNDSKKSIIPKGEDDYDVIIYNDGRIEKTYLGYFEIAAIDSFDINFKTKYYLVGYENKNSQFDDNIKVINLASGKSKTASSEIWSKYFYESLNGKYIILNRNDTNKKRIVLDENLDTIYETDNILEVVNDRFAIEYNPSNETEIYLVNVFTKEKTKLDTKGKYYSNNAVGLITSFEGKYNLYAFN